MFTRRQLALSTLALFAPAAAARATEGTAAGPVTAKIRLTQTRVLIDARLNGKGPFPFVVDTGALLGGVRLGLAKELALPQKGRTPMNGKVFPVYGVDDFELGGAVRQAGVALFGLDRPAAAMGGDGLVAAGMLTSFDSELDFERGEWRLFTAGRADRGGSAPVPVRLQEMGPVGMSRRIVAECAVGGETILAVLDTGTTWPVVLDNVTARKLGLWKAATPYAPMRAQGFAGPADDLSRVVRVSGMKVGAVTYGSTLVQARPPLDTALPILGLGVLRTLHLSFDKAGKALWVRRNALPPTPELRYAYSGLWLEADGGAVKVIDVGTGSPAAQAGVRPGDVLEGASDARAATAMVNREGVPVSVKLRRAGALVEASFTPRPYL